MVRSFPQLWVEAQQLINVIIIIVIQLIRLLGCSWWAAALFTVRGRALALSIRLLRSVLRIRIAVFVLPFLRVRVRVKVNPRVNLR